MDPTKASNALVATIDFYSSLVAALRAELQSKDEIIKQLGLQMKSLATREEVENRVLSAAVDWNRNQDLDTEYALIDAIRKMEAKNA